MRGIRGGVLRSGNLSRFGCVFDCMRTLWLAGGLLLAAWVAACDDELPIASQPQQAESAAQEQQAEPAQGSSARTTTTQPQLETRTTVIQTSVQEQQAEVRPVDEAVPAGQSSQAESDAGDEDDAATVPASALAEVLKELTEVPAVVVSDAEMRVRPGLAWGVSRRLAAGDDVVVLSRSSGWLRIRVDVCEGWVRSAALDLGEVDEAEILVEAAAPIIAEWQGVEYGVMGQSADAAEVRLLGESEEIVSAPKGEVTLLAEDITLDDLPVLIGDETVVFPGDDFRAGQGKILPRADEWMWLPWGWLLAHNEEYIWQWRPETDELEFIRRPAGPAKFSPDGSHLAVLDLCESENVGCTGSTDVVLIPLDGSTPVSLRQSVQRVAELPEIVHVLGRSAQSLQWNPGSTAVLVYVKRVGFRAWWWPVVVINVDGTLTYFDFETLPLSVDAGECNPQELNDDRGDAWYFRSDGKVAANLICATGDDRELYDMVFDVRGKPLGFERVADSAFDGLSPFAATVIGADELGDDAYELSDGSDLYSIVVAPERRNLFIYDKRDGLAHLIGGSPYGVPERFWDVLELGPGFARWDLYWTDRHVAIVVRAHITVVVGGLLVDLSTANAFPIQVGSIRTWPCFPTGGWSPNETAFQIEFKTFSTSGRVEEFWIDGTAAPDGAIAQRQVVNSAGEILAVMRAVAHLKFLEPTHIAGWSADGGWLAIGGHQELGHYCG